MTIMSGNSKESLNIFPLSPGDLVVAVPCSGFLLLTIFDGKEGRREGGREVVWWWRMTGRTKVEPRAASADHGQ